MGRKPTCECGACKKCLHREYMNRWYRRPGAAERVRGWAKRYREENIERVRAYDNRRKRPHDPVKAHARAAVNHAVFNGELERGNACEECGVEGLRASDGRSLIQAHHDDYSKPLEIRWLCATCHGREHRKVA